MLPVTRSLTAARVLVAAAVLVAPAVNAFLLWPDGHAAWPILLALALGAGTRLVWPGSPAPLLAALAVAPWWQAGAGLVTGTTDPQLLMPWIAFLGAWLAWPRGAAWHVSGPWLAGLVPWALVVAAAWPVTAWRELDFTLQTIGAGITNGSLGATPHAVAAAVALAASAQLVALLLFDWAWGAAPETRLRAWRALAPGVAAACLLAVWQQAVDPAALSREPWIGLNRAAGPFFDANAMGALAALAGAAIAGPGVCPAGLPRGLWSAVWAALALAGAVASGSRTALAALCVATILTGLVALRGGRRVALAAALVVALIAAGRLGPAQDETPLGNAVGRLAGTVQRLMAGGAAGIVDLAWRRDGYGPASLAMIAEHPWVGVGPGTFGTVIADYALVTVGTRLPPDNAQNWWRQQLADLGLLGALGALLCSVLAVVAIATAWRRSPAAAARALPLVALGLMAFVSPPTQHPLLQVLMGLAVAHAVAPWDATAPRPAGPAPAAVAAAAWALALACAIGLAVEGRTTLRPSVRASRFHFAYNYGVSALVRTPFGEGRWAARHSVAVFAPAAPALVVTVTLPHDDLARAPVTVTIAEGAREACRLEIRDHTPVECRVAMPEERWPIVRVAVSRAWRRENGEEQAALVAARFDR